MELNPVSARGKNSWIVDSGLDRALSVIKFAQDQYLTKKTETTYHTYKSLGRELIFNNKKMTASYFRLLRLSSPEMAEASPGLETELVYIEQVLKTGVMPIPQIVFTEYSKFDKMQPRKKEEIN